MKGVLEIFKRTGINPDQEWLDFLNTLAGQAAIAVDSSLLFENLQRLHDIGKMGIPDSIRLKPGPLNDEELEIMRKHPVFGYEMLSPIRFLRAALDIPYCHHERWDGKGYPRGLKGEQIPLAARIFALTDVCDALCSDRPYRTAWPKERIFEHIRSLAGNHLDRKVVEVFLELGKENFGL